MNPLRILAIIFLFAINATLAQPLSGNYTIDSGTPTGGTNFQSFTDFATSINTNGIAAAVVATIVANSGPYNEQVVFDNISGTSAANTVTIEGNGETIYAAVDSAKRHLIRLKNCEYFNINNLNFVRDTASTYIAFYGVHILSTGQNISVSNCNFDIKSTTSTLAGGIVASGSETSLLSSGTFHNMQFMNNTSVGGGYGVSVFGNVNDLSTNIVIDGNYFNDIFSNCVYLRETNGAIVSNNHFDKTSSLAIGTNYIQIAQAANVNAQIFGNYMQVSATNNGTQRIRGIYLFDGTGHRVYNNVIHHVHLLNGGFTGIEIRTAGTAPEISYNTISIDTTAPSTGLIYGIKEELSNTNAILQNNVISMTQPCSTKAALFISSISNVTTTFNSNFNDFYVTNGGDVAYKNSSTPVYYNTLGDWQSASGQDANSVSVSPDFISFSAPIPTNAALDNTGIVIPGITTDILGTPRAVNPDMGAYEFTSTGIHSIKYQNQLTSYPNPVTTELNVIIPGGGNTTINMNIVDVTGRTIIKSYNNINLNNGLCTVNTAELREGIYFVKITAGSEQYHTSFIKK